MWTSSSSASPIAHHNESTLNKAAALVPSDDDSTKDVCTTQQRSLASGYMLESDTCAILLDVGFEMCSQLLHCAHCRTATYLARLSKLMGVLCRRLFGTLGNNSSESCPSTSCRHFSVPRLFRPFVLQVLVRHACPDITCSSCSTTTVMFCLSCTFASLSIGNVVTSISATHLSLLSASFSVPLPHFINHSVDLAGLPLERANGCINAFPPLH